MKAFSGAIDVFMLDPNGIIMKRWLSRQSNLGTVSLDYQLSDQPIFGVWKVKVRAQNQVEEATFSVEEYYQTRFEVNVTMPAFFFNSDPYIHGIVMANYTSGAPVRGNLTLKAIIRPIKPIDLRKQPHRETNQLRDQYVTNRLYAGYNERRFGPPNYNEYDNRYQYSEYDTSSYNKPIVEKYFNFVSIIFSTFNL